MKTDADLNLNLLPSQAKFQAARMKLQALLKRYMTLAIIFWVSLVVVVVILHFGSVFVLSVVNKKYTRALANYKSLSSEITVNQSLKYRAKVLGVVLQKRFEYSSAFEKINSIFGEKTTVSGFELGKVGEFLIAVSANGKEGVDDIEDKVMKINQGEIEGMESAKIKNIGYFVNDPWKIELEVILK